ncbi:methyltransferase [Kitasatospora sp. NPDC101183]|uniref:methyltransferase n=1 Tax=Kitasatospora sp. NPDC101183 TaxID=3364100 RepID=UPI00381C8228
MSTESVDLGRDDPYLPTAWRERRTRISSVADVVELSSAFRASKTMLSAVELGVFTELANGPLDGEQLRTRLGLHERSAADFLDALVSLGLLDRDDEGRYANGAVADQVLDRAKPGYLGGVMEMRSTRLYQFWGNLTEALRTGQPQNEARTGGDPFSAIYADPVRLRAFQRAMSALSLEAVRELARKFPWERYRTVADLGCSEGALLGQVALRHPHLRGTGHDLPAVRAGFEEYVAGLGLSDRLTFGPMDFFIDAFPTADVLVFAHILHDWDAETKLTLLREAHDALPKGGAVVVLEALIDDERRVNTFGLLQSLNMLIETPGGFDFTAADGRTWLAEAGFRDIRAEHLAGPEGMLVAFK